MRRRPGLGLERGHGKEKGEQHAGFPGRPWALGPRGHCLPCSGPGAQTLPVYGLSPARGAEAVWV